MRLLGIRLAADGNFRDELKYRISQSQTIAGRLHASPLRGWSAWQVYYCRYKPAIGYCLSITTFTNKECDKIQSPFYNILLPRMGLNRHMPRAVVCGPPSHAGLEMMDIKVEQIARHIEGVVTQIRKNDKVGKTIRATIDMMQIYLGTKNNSSNKMHTNSNISQVEENQQ